MEAPQVTIKLEKVDNFALATQPNISYQTQMLDIMDIKVESVKIEPYSFVCEPNNSDQHFELSEEPQRIRNNDKYMLDSSVEEFLSKQKDLDIKLEYGEEFSEMVKIENWPDETQAILNKELNIKEEDQTTRNSTILVPEKPHKEGATKSTKKKHNDDLKCNYCDYMATQKRYLRFHLMKHKKPDEVIQFRCEFCEYETIYQRYLKVHLLKHKNPDELVAYKCDQCDFQSVQKRYLKRHLLIHKNPNEVSLYKCDQCDYQAIYKRTFKHHLLKHKNPDEVDSYKCYLCKFETTQKMYLKHHIFRHRNPDEVDLYKCDQCDFRTVHKRTLNHHLIKHKNPDEIELYNCHLCNFKTVQKIYLTRHLSRHKKSLKG